MRASLLASGVMALLATKASATALTYKLLPSDKQCFYAATEQKAQKIAFYFAVRRAAPRCIAKGSIV
jgi:hypothetical protein